VLQAERSHAPYGTDAVRGSRPVRMPGQPELPNAASLLILWHITKLAQAQRSRQCHFWDPAKCLRLSVPCWCGRRGYNIQTGWPR